MPSKQPRARRAGARAKSAARPAPLYAAVDLGTNNCRLLIARRAPKGFRIVDSHSQLARLGEGLAASGRLAPAAVERAMDALSQIRDKLKVRRVAHVRCIATEACRQAENGAAFIARVREELGLSFRIIGPQEEARLAMLGCHDLIAPEAGTALVLDTGGGSTEVSLVDGQTVAASKDLASLARAPAIRAWGSMPLGVVTLSEAFAHLDEAEGYRAMRAHAREVLSGWKHASQARAAMAEDGAHIIGTSGTVTCLAGVHLGLETYRRSAVDGAWLTRQEADAAIAALIDAGLDGRARMGTIGPERAPLMLSGCAILDAAWSEFPAARMRVADRGLREGLLLTMMYGPKKKRRRRRGRGNGKAARS